MFEIEHFLLVAESVLGIDADRLTRITKLPLAESALGAPFAGVADQQFYEHPVQQAAILASRIIRNHPLPDGNKRVAFILMSLYLEEHGFELVASPDEIDRIFRAVAARHHSEDYFVAWLCSRTQRLGAGD
ncbi:MAG TPA: type II toxin-antitoxin system death-on-curing family toxin [Solirubrobacteraceae bacterium]|nr:type II toxin-antitoxin system death-on-curing family toxin [Solirubrobacteraceae bacterium]